RVGAEGQHRRRAVPPGEEPAQRPEAPAPLPEPRGGELTMTSKTNLKRRIVGVLVVKDGIVVQSIGFRKYLPVGIPEIAVEYLNRWGIDEIIVLDIDATPAKRGPSIDVLTRLP